MSDSMDFAKDLGEELLKFWESQIDDLPHHYLMHFAHCAEIVGFRHPHPEIAHFWVMVYGAICRSFHMNPEPPEQLTERLRDRRCH